MASSKLSSKSAANKKPIICRAPPVPPIEPLKLSLIPDVRQCLINDLVPIELYGNHPSRARGEPYVADWSINHGAWDTTPESLNRMDDEGSWRAPDYPCIAVIKITATWPDTAQLFTFCLITVNTY